MFKMKSTDEFKNNNTLIPISNTGAKYFLTKKVNCRPLAGNFEAKLKQSQKQMWH